MRTQICIGALDASGAGTDRVRVRLYGADADAVSRYLDEEARHVERYMEAIDSRSPYKAGKDEP